MTSTDQQRLELHDAATVIEAETRGQLPAVAFGSLAEDEILPAAVSAGPLLRLLPANVCVDKQGLPTTLEHTRKPRIGAVALYESLLVVAWETAGLVSTGSTSLVVDRSEIRGASAWRSTEKGWIGVDVVTEGRRLALVFGDQMAQALTQGWAEELAALLGTVQEGEATTRGRLTPDVLLAASAAVDLSVRGSGTEAAVLRRLAVETTGRRAHCRSLDALDEHASEQLELLGDEPALWADEGERRAWLTVRELVQARG